MKANAEIRRSNAKLITIEQAMNMYSMSRITANKLAENSGSKIKIGRMVRVDREKLERFMGITA